MEERPTTIEPIFVFSVTRSGSTLLQRVLGAYDEIATASEPWILFPLLYSRRKHGVLAEYTHYLMVDAVEDFTRQLPGGPEEYRDELRRLALRLYARASKPGARYFLDKTPPYFLIVDEVMELFPEARCIFLWRNPLSIAASLIEFDGDRWDPVRYPENLFVGPAKLVAAYERNRDRVCAVRFEDLVGGSEEPWRRIADHIGVEYDAGAVERFSAVRLEGRLGDPIGVNRYSRLSDQPVEKWKERVDTPVKRAWFARMLRWIGRDRLAVMGYDMDALLDELDALPVSWRAAPVDVLKVARAALEEPPRVQARRMLRVPGASALRYVAGAPARQAQSIPTSSVREASSTASTS
jgi:hypothetical protein